MKQAVVGADAPQDVIDVVEEDSRFSFPKEHKTPLMGLLFLGYLEDEFDYAGHRFVIHTLTQGELLIASNLIERYESTIGRNRAYKASILACAVKSVDGQPLYQPLSESEAKEDMTRKAFDVVLQWFPNVVDELYDRFEHLDRQVSSVVKSLGES